MSDRNVLPCILTGIGTIFVTVGVLWYYGYLHFAKPQDALLLADFTMLKSLPGEDVKLSWSRPSRSRSASMASWCCSTLSRRAFPACWWTTGSTPCAAPDRKSRRK